MQSDTISLPFQAVTAAVAAAAPASDEDGVNTLIETNDSLVRQKVGEAFVAQMQNSGHVRSLFFGNPPAPAAPMPAAQEDWIGQVASALIALSLSHTSGHGFAQTVNSGNAQNFLNNNLNPGNPNFVAVAMHNYESLFANYCQANNTAFAGFLNCGFGDAARWGTLLATRLSSTNYINQEFPKLNPAVASDDWYQAFYGNLYKVQRLNPSEVQRVTAAWHPYLAGKEVPGSLPWTVYDHMVAGSYTYSTFFGPVLSAISAYTSSTQTLGCQGGPAAHCTTETTTVYGGPVNDWLGRYRGLGGFLNGPSGSNTESHTNGSGGGGFCGCFVPGTPILLADGSSRAVEEIGPGTAVISRDGSVHCRSDQDVHWQIDAHELLFGINDYPPFFNASHPFMTTAGWKSMAPKVSRQINSDLDIFGPLQVGDMLLQAEEGLPLRYRQVRINQITRMLARDAGSQNIYSLHLRQDNPGYHAHGFLVAVNYPQLREDRFVQAFAGITDAEREYLRNQIMPLIPFLRRGLGGYVGEILRRALGGTEARPLGGPTALTVRHD